MSEEWESFQYQGETEIRLDKLLADHLKAFSRTFLQKRIADGDVSVDGEVIQRKSEPILPGARIEVYLPPPAESSLEPEQIPLEILFENRDLIVVNKPAGMVVHPAAGHPGGTLVQAALAYAPDIEGVGGVRRPGLVHRLDQDTSGVILLAKNDRTHRYLQDQFRARTVEKTYLALVDGRPPTPQGRIEVAIGRDPNHRQKLAAVPRQSGKEAISEYFTLATLPEHTLLEVRILTGRTHQIRIHLAYLNCPVVGDTMYGRSKPSLPVERQFLHASRLKIKLPGERVQRTFEAPLPEELKMILSGFGYEKDVFNEMD